MTVQLEHSQCPLVEMYSITSLFILYRYDSGTGTFTVPPGGEGFYYFSSYMRVYGDESAEFDIEINGARICSVTADLTDSPIGDREITSCSGATYLLEGYYVTYLTVQLIYVIILFL